VSVNLAAAIAETGSRTLAANADFRRPTLQRALTGRPPPPNPLEIEDLEIVNVRSLLSDTAASRLKIVDFSTVDAAPGELVRALTHRLEDLRSVSEQIVVDTSPVGSTAEVLDLLPHADTIVLVARVGHTSTQAMARAAAILGDIATAPIIFVLEGIKADRSQFYVDTDQNVRRLPQMPEPGEQPTLESVE
jgi:Mrp family chromosome partitioning ATPase